MLQMDIPTVETLPVLRRDGASRHFVVVAVPDADPFDIIGPLTVLREANLFLEQSGRADLRYEFEFVTNVPGTLFAADGFRMQVDRSCYDIQGDVDTIVFQAIDIEGKCLHDERFLDWVRGIAPTTRRMATACIGTYILAQAGLLDGRRAATHWAVGSDFRRRYPDVELDDDPIYIKDGKFYTSAGVTSILDLMLALVEEDFGSELALRVAQGLVMFLRRPATQSQFSKHLAELTTDHRQIRAAVSHIADNLDDDLTVPSLSRVAAMSPRHFSRVFSREIGITPGKFVELSRLEAARRYLEQSNLSIDEVARQCGYGTRDGLRLAFDRTLGVPPREYRNRFR